MEPLEERRLLACNELDFDASPLFADGGPLHQLQAAIDQATYIGNQIPFLGEQLTDTVPFGVDIRQSLLTAYESGTGAVHEKLEQALTDVLGPANYDLLDQVLDITFDSEACTVTATIDISRTLAAWESPGFTFDVGLESLPIYAGADVSGVELELGFDLSPLSISLDLDSGAITLDTDGTTFSMELNASFADDASLSAQVGFLHMQISDGIGPAPADNQRSGLNLGAEIVFGPGFSPQSAQLSGDANLYLHMQTEANDYLPSIAADFILEYDLTAGTEPDVRFENVSVALGDLVDRFLGPVIDIIEPIIEPLDKVTDVLTAPIPLISDLGLGDVSVLQIANALANNGALPPDITAYVKVADAITRIIDFVALFESNDCVVAGCSEALINFGDLPLSDINGDLRALESKIANPTLFDADISGISIGNVADLSQLIDQIDQLSLPAGVKQTLSQGLQDINDQLNSGITIELPILDSPGAVIFQWLVGRNADIFRVDAGIKLEPSDIDLGGPMPIGINGGLRGGFAPSIHVGLGYDTFGLRRFVDNVRNDTNPSAADFLEGFYITGDSELSIEGFLEAYLSLDALVFSVEAAGGVRAGLLAEVIDSSEDPTLPNVDGDPHKVRFASELGPCAFHLAGEVTAGISLTAKLGIELGPIFFGVQHRWDVAEAQLASFDVGCIGNPLEPAVEHVLGEVDDNGVLTLYVGSLGGNRSVETTTIDEDFSLVAASPDPDGPPPTGQSVRINAFGVSHVVHNVTQIVADMGAGNDRLTIGEGITVPVEAHGGTGDDVLRSFASGGTTLFGDEGNDWIVGGTGVNLLFGDDGNDTLRALGAPDTNLSIAGGAGDDLIYGGPGANALDGGDGNDTIIGGAGSNIILGGSGNDVIAGGAGSIQANGGAGDDLVTWGPGNGPITFDGEGGTDSLGMVGSAQNDTFVLTQQDGAIHVVASSVGSTVETVSINVEQISVDGLEGRDQTLVQPLTGSPLTHLSINLSDNLAADHVEDLISIHGTPIRDELTVENVSATLTELPAHDNRARGGVMRFAGFRSHALTVALSYEILAMNQFDRILLNSHDANDLIHVLGATGPTWVDASEGDDELRVDAARPSLFANQVGDFLSEIHVDGGAGSNRLAVSERLTLIEDTIEVTDRTITSQLLPGLHYESLDGGSFGGGIFVAGGDHDDTLNVASTRRGAVTTVEGSGGNDDVNVSSEFVLPGGNMNAIRGPLVIDGGDGHTTTALVDATDGNPSPLTTIALSNIGGLDGVTVSGLAGPENDVDIHVIDRPNQTLRLETSQRPTAPENFLVHGTIQGETIINDQDGDATYQIDATVGPLRIVGQAGDETVFVTTTTQSWTDLAATLTIEAGSGQDRLEISDESALELTFYELGAGHLTRGPASAGEILFDSQLEQIELRTAAASDTLNVVSLPAATQVAVDQGTGNNAMTGPSTGAEWIVDGPNHGSLQGQIHFTNTGTLGSSGGASTFSILDGGSLSGSLWGSPSGFDVLDFSGVSTPVTVDLQAETATHIHQIRYLDRFIGGADDDTLIGRNAINTWTVDGAAQGSLEATDEPTLREFQSFEHLVGGNSSDLILIASAGELSSFDGSGGIDELSYTLFLTPVEVDLQAGTATYIGVVSQIENVRGGAADDVLLGNDSNNLLIGMGGDDILVGRGGHDTLHGEAGDDLLIGGGGSDSLNGGGDSDLIIANATIHDNEPSELTSLHAEWKRDDTSYGRRINALRNGTGLNAPLQLVAASVLADMAIDQLFGGDDDDWFWSDELDVLLGAAQHEVVN